MATTHTITVTLNTASPPTLALSPSGEIDVDDGDTVEWKVASSSTASTNVTKITAIDYTSGTHLFSGEGAEPPTGSDGDTIWTGVVGSTPTAGNEESYTISFQITGGSTIYIDDPKLKINNSPT